MSNYEYQRYLLSPEWRALKTRIMERDRGLCQFCFGPADAVHHLTYRHIFGEPESDLAAVCNLCHTLIHKYPWPTHSQREWMREVANDNTAHDGNYLLNMRWTRPAAANDNDVIVAPAKAAPA